MDDIQKALKDGLDSVHAQLKSEFEAMDKKHEVRVAELNEDAAKKGESIGELKEKVDKLIATNGKLKATFENEAFASNRQKSLIVDVANAITENYDAIKGETPFNSKAVGVMTLGAIGNYGGLTGTSVLSYVENPIMRSYFSPHLYDVFRIIPTATGNVTFPRGNSPVGEGSFGAQTEASAKANVDYDVTMVNISVPFIAGYAKVSRQMLQDLPFLQAYLSSSLIEDWNRAVDNRFMATITASATAGSTSSTGAAPRIIDYLGQHGALGLGMADTILTTHAVWAQVLNTLPSNGSYSIPGGITIGASGETRIAGIALVPHNAIPTGRIYVFNREAFAIAQASGLAVRSTETDQDDFIKNLVTYRCEARVELLSFQPTAAIYGSAS
jgi:HK97 family phage major capsid protein